MTVELAVIVLNYRTAQLTIDCLASLEGEIEEGVQVLVVDNASGDGSAERIEEAIRGRAWSGWASLLRAPVNGGFAAGNNLGIGALAARAYVLLNSDTVAHPGSLRALREAMGARPDAGIVGAGLLNGRGDRDQSAFRLLAPMSELVRAAGSGPVARLLRRYDPALPVSGVPMEVDWLGFACVLIRREVIEAIGPLDDGFFMYFEDVDYCRRARRAGWKILYWPDSRVVHLLGGSSGVTEASARRRRPPRYYYEARARYFAKFYGRGGLWLANGLWYLGHLVSLARRLAGRPATHREREALDIWINGMAPLPRGAGRPDRG